MVGLGSTAARLFGRKETEPNSFSQRRDSKEHDEDEHTDQKMLRRLSLTQQHEQLDHMNVENNCLQGMLCMVDKHGESQLFNVELEFQKFQLRYKPAVLAADVWKTVNLITVEVVAVGSEIGVPFLLEQLDIEVAYTGYLEEEKDQISILSFGVEPSRTLYFRCKSLLEREEWARALKSTAKAAQDEHHQAHEGTWMLWLSDLQKVLSKIYDSDAVQFTACFAIFLNFCFSIAESQMQPATGSASAIMFQRVDFTFAIIFAAELAWNMTANFWSKFWASGWNLFDFGVVISSMVGLVMNGGSSVSVLRLFRALRAFRLFRRIESLRKVLTALVNSVLPVLNAFVVLALITAIYAIMGVNFFGDQFDEFRDFFNSLFTMFQVLTGDSWAQEIARPIIDWSPAGASAYFVSFVLLASMVLINVMVAILLDEFAKAGEKGTEGLRKSNLDSHDLLYEMIRPLLHCQSERDAKKFINNLWAKVDYNNDEKVEMSEVKKYIESIAHPGSKLARGKPSESELVNRRIEELMQDGRFCDPTGRLDKDGFDRMLRAYATKYTVHISGSGHAGAKEKGVTHEDFARLEARVDDLMGLMEKVHKTCKTSFSPHPRDHWDVLSERSEVDSEAVAPRLMLKQMVQANKSMRLTKQNGGQRYNPVQKSESGEFPEQQPGENGRISTISEKSAPNSPSKVDQGASNPPPTPPIRISSHNDGKHGGMEEEPPEAAERIGSGVKNRHSSPQGFIKPSNGPTLARHVTPRSPRFNTPNTSRDQLRRSEPDGSQTTGPLNGFFSDFGGFLSAQRNTARSSPGQWLFNFGGNNTDELAPSKELRTQSVAEHSVNSFD